MEHSKDAAPFYPRGTQPTSPSKKGAGSGSSASASFASTTAPQSARPQAHQIKRGPPKSNESVAPQSDSSDAASTPMNPNARSYSQSASSTSRWKPAPASGSAGGKGSSARTPTPGDRPASGFAAAAARDPHSPSRNSAARDPHSPSRNSKQPSATAAAVGGATTAGGAAANNRKPAAEGKPKTGHSSSGSGVSHMDADAATADTDSADEKESIAGTALYDRKVLMDYLLQLKNALDDFNKSSAAAAAAASTDSAKPAQSRPASQHNTNDSSTHMAQISHYIERVCAVKLPNRLPSWTSEICAAIIVFGMLPADLLRAQDFANISRLITRACFEKQLLLGGDELVSIYNLLMFFLKKSLAASVGSGSGSGSGSGTDSAVREPGSAAPDAAIRQVQGQGQGIGGDSSLGHRLLATEDATVLHEVMRAVAQLLLVRDDKFSCFRYDAISCLVRFCDPRSNFNIECRHTAVDGLCNLLKVPADAKSLLPPPEYHSGPGESDAEVEAGRRSGGGVSVKDDKHSLSLSQVAELEDFVALCHKRGEDIPYVDQLASEARRGVYLRMRSEKLAEINGVAVYLLLENLKLSSSKLVASLTSVGHDKQGQNERSAGFLGMGELSSSQHTAVYNKLLVSCLRALAHILIAAVPFSPYAIALQQQQIDLGVGASTRALSSMHVKTGTDTSAAAALPDDTGNYTTPAFAPYLQSLTQSVLFLHTRLLPMVLSADDMLANHLGATAAVSSKPHRAPHSHEGAHLASAPHANATTTAEEKLWIHTLKLCSAIASYDPMTFQSSWSLFLADSQIIDSSLESAVSRIIAAKRLVIASDMTSSAADAGAGVDATSGTVAVPGAFPALKSPILNTAMWAASPQIRAAAITCLRSFVESLPLAKWVKGTLRSSSAGASQTAGPSAVAGPGRTGASKKQPKAKPAGGVGANNEKVGQTVLKILRVLIMLTTVERSEVVVKEIFDCATALLTQLPLAELPADTHNAAPQSARHQEQNPAPSPTTATAESRGFPLLESLAKTFFENAMVIAAENPYYVLAAPHFDAAAGAGAAAGGAAEEAEAETGQSIRFLSPSAHAINWLTDICKRCAPLASYADALKLPVYYAGAGAPVDVRGSAAPQGKSGASAKAGGKNFIHIAAEMCALVEHDKVFPFAVAAYHNGCRQLQHNLLQSYPSLYLSDPAWLRYVIDDCRSSRLSQRRLLGIKMTCSLLMLQWSSTSRSVAGKSLGDADPAEFDGVDDELTASVEAAAKKISMDTLVGVHTLMEVTTLLLLGARDSDHLIRAQSVGSFGQFASPCWVAMREHHGFLSDRLPSIASASSASGAGAFSYPPPSATFSAGMIDTSVRAAVLQCLILACGDSVGTVRTAAQKSIGEAIVLGGLALHIRAAAPAGAGTGAGAGASTEKSVAGIPRYIFVIAGSNKLQDRVNQAEQVQAEALQKSEQVAAQAHATQSLTPNERLHLIQKTNARSFAPRHTAAASAAAAATAENAQTTSNSAQGVSSGSLLQNKQKAPIHARHEPEGAGVAAAAGTFTRRSHQIDHSVEYGIPLSASIQANSPRGDLCVDTTSAGEYSGTIWSVLKCLEEGCLDSKLAVRLQACWALGNLLLVVLPTRQAAAFPSSAAVVATLDVSLYGSQMYEPEAGSQAEWCSDATWLSLCNVCMQLLEDSDKLLASSVRCLGFLAAGLSPWDGTHFGYLSALVDVLIQKVLLSGKGWGPHGVIQEGGRDMSQLIQEQILQHPHKLIYSVCQSLGYVGWVLVNRGDHDAGGVTPAVTSCINRIRRIQAHMLRHGKLKVQLQACKALVSEIYNYSESGGDGSGGGDWYGEGEGEEEGDLATLGFSKSRAYNQLGNANAEYGMDPDDAAPASDERTATIVQALESCLVVVSNSLLLDDSLSASIFAQPLAVESAHARINVNHKSTKHHPFYLPAMQFVASKKSAAASGTTAGFGTSSGKALLERARLNGLQRGLLVLLWVILRQEWRGAHSSDQFIEVLTYHAESVVEWLRRMLADDRALSPSELSMTQLPLVSTAPACALSRGSSPCLLVPMVAKRFLNILLVRQTSLSGRGSGHFPHGGVSYKSNHIAITSVAWERLEALGRLCQPSPGPPLWTGRVPPGLSGSGQGQGQGQGLGLGLGLGHAFGAGMFSGLHAHVPLDTLLEGAYSQARGIGNSSSFDEDYAEETRVNGAQGPPALPLPSLDGGFAVADESAGAPHIGVLSAHRLLASPPTKPSAQSQLNAAAAAYGGGREPITASASVTAVAVSLEDLALSAAKDGGVARAAAADNDDDPDEI